MTVKKCPCPEAQKGECCKHCLTAQINDEVVSVVLVGTPESPLYAMESGEEIRPFLHHG